MSLFSKEPDPKDVRKAFEDMLNTNPDKYNRLNLDDFFLGFCMAKGMAAKDAIPFVQENSVVEDGK